MSGNRKFPSRSAMLGEPLSHRLAHALRRAGQKRDFAFKIE